MKHKVLNLLWLECDKLRKDHGYDAWMLKQIAEIARGITVQL